MDGLEIKTKPWRKGWKNYPDEGSWVVESSEWTIFVPSKATANLIAAAPDLYEALEGLANGARSLCDEYPESLELAVYIADLALAKARGE